MKNKSKAFISLILASLMIFSSFAVGASADSVKRVSCTMYGDGKSARGFCWYTLENSSSDIEILKKDDFSGSFDNAAHHKGSTSKFRNQYVHKVNVGGLAPGTEYVYRVGDASKNMWSEQCSFVTDDGDGKFAFVSIADVQASSDENFAHAALTLKGAFDIEPEAEFFVNLGDYVNDNTNSEWDWYFKNFAFAHNTLTHVPVAGNHDGNITNKFNTNCFKNMFNADESDNQSIEGVYYSFDYGSAHFAVLNTNDMYPISQAQRNWLVNDMKTSAAKWKILLMHRPIYAAGKNINKPDTLVMRDILIPLIDKLDIDMVYAGHDHMYLRTTQVCNDKAVENIEYVDEIYKGETLTFALNPQGTVHALPSTGGTKRYAFNEKAIKPILQVADKAFSTRGMGGCFCTTEIDGDKLVYKAYLVDDETQEISLIDVYAIKKTTQGRAESSKLDQSIAATLFYFPVNLIVAVFKMFVAYCKLLFNV